MRIILAVLLGASTLTFAIAQDSASQPPNILLMMADDLGFSDIGCYGSEIPTPNLDRLANRGLKFSDFTNTSRCCPSRASLLTGMYSHQVGIGDMNYKGNTPAYAGQISTTSPLIPELLKEAGYSTAMVGKWHLTRSPTIPNGPNGSWPFQRGFDKFFGSMEGAKNYFAPSWLFDQEKEIKSFTEGFYYTNAVSERAAKWIRGQPKDKPLFLYTAFYAPHFPLQAPNEVIAKYRGKYMSGWDKLRAARLAKQESLGMHPVAIQLSPRADDMPAWETLPRTQQEILDLRMATYAAQVEMLDRGVGRLLDALEESGRSESTLILFLSDNGAASSGGVFGAGPSEKVGLPDAPIKTTYGRGWATLSNTPYRMYKANTHEGGTKAPLIVVPPSSTAAQDDVSKSDSSRIWRRDQVHIIDIAPTIYFAAGLASERYQHCEGIDLLSQNRTETDAVFYEHEKSRAARQGSWKLVNRGKSRDWELYDLSQDPTELNDLTEATDRRRQMIRLWRDWAQRCGVKY